MNIAIHSKKITLDQQEKSHLIRRVQFALGRFASRISNVSVKVSDLNGPRGGIDKRCRLAARVQGLGEVIVQDDDAELQPLVDRIAERMGHLIGRRLERQRFGHDRVSFSGPVSESL
jgi:hypothetical protein